MTDLGAIDEDVPFDAAAADALIATFDGAASAIDDQVGARTVFVTTALQDFRGHFSDLFRTNGATAKGDGSELSTRLREVSSRARELKAAAAAEQKRRLIARKWKHDRDSRSGLHKAWDAVTGGGDEDPPVGPPDPPIHRSVASAPVAARQAPAPGSVAAGGGTSSARPSDLRNFATGSSHANTALRPKLARAKSDLAHFVATCRWGTLSATGVTTGFDKWLAANDQDVQWATVVAGAFEQAGGTGAISTVSNSALAASLQASGVSATRADLTIPGPMAVGHPPTTGYAVDPVNTATGNFVETESDLGFAGACAGLELTRTYNSLATATTAPRAFGPGWSSWTEAGLHLDDEAAYVVLPDGRHLQFPRLGTGWDRATGENLWLVADERGGYVASDNAGTRWTFSAAGRLVERSTGPGTSIHLTWADTRLVRVRHHRGRWIDLLWSTVAGSADELRVTGLQASDGRRARFDYDDRGRLVAATGPLGTREYRWDDASGLIAAVVGADGTLEAENAYDDQGRVTRQRTAHGRLVRFGYLPGRVTVVSDEDGTRSNTWIADERGRLVGVVDADEQRQSMSYDAHGNQVLAVERNGDTTVREYDARGRLVRWVAPGGADFTQEWDDQDRLTALSVTTEPGEEPAVTGFAYDGAERNPSRLTDAEGGVTRMSWVDGVLTTVVDPVGVTVRFAYDVHGELVATTDAEGSTARLARDRSGRVVAATTPSGHTTRFGYDEVSGLLSERTDPDGAVWRYEHTASGRVSAVVDPLGGRTEMEHGPEGEVVRTVDPLGRAVTRRLDDLGNVAAVELPDGSTWQFGHDPMSRLREITDASGAVSAFEYDAAGALSATTDPGGERTEVSTDVTHGVTEVVVGSLSSTVKVDRMGRLVASERPDGTTVLTRYDRCGRPVEVVDADGGLTTSTRDAAGRVVAMTRPGGSTVHYEYDACGRTVAVVDPLGGRSTLTYDVDGRVVARTGPTGEVTTSELDECGRLLRRRTPGVGTSSFSYDLAGRLVATRDPQLGRRRFRYDAAGQLVEAVAGNGGTTRWEYDVNGRAVAIVDAAGGVTRREWDAANLLVAETDPLGRTTRAGYDANGRQEWQLGPDGRRTEWRYDAGGRVAEVLADGRVVSSITRDVSGRRISILDSTDPDRPPVTHELVWDARGNLVSRTRDGRGLSWTYDAESRRTSRTGPAGDTTRYVHDPSGRVSAIEHPLLGRVRFTYDGAGRVLVVEARRMRQSWTWEDGFIASHTVWDGIARSRTSLERDDDGRVAGLERDGVRTRFEHDDACQLVRSRTTEGGTTSTTRWRYDLAGRLVGESRGRASRALTYDAAGQLVSSGEFDGRVLAYSYDEAGRRTRESGTDGSTREYSWSSTGWLSGVVDSDALGERRRLALAVDATGELARLGDDEVFFDTADSRAPSVAQLGERAVVATGVATGIGRRWETPGWRGVRTDATDPDDPWGSVPLGVGPAGELGLGGLEWLGARVYDPAARSFLSVDPLEPVLGASWSGNPYAYAGNDPLHASDPTGLRPATDADLAAYAASHQGMLSSAVNATGHWLKDNWEYVAGGAMVVAGGVLIATGVGGPAGMMLVSAGADTIIQKATTGRVDWGEVVVSGAVGGFGGAGVAARAGLTGIRATVAAGVASGGLGGGATGAYGYVRSPGPHTAGGFLAATGEGMGEGAALGGIGGGAGHAIGGKIMATMTHNPGADTMTMGRVMSDRVIPYATEHETGYYTGTPSTVHNFVGDHFGQATQGKVDLWTNKKWINYQMNQGKHLVDIGAPVGPHPVSGDPISPSSFYDMERAQVSHQIGRHTLGGNYSVDHQPAWDLH